jgi:gamma-glutamyltranspeptidase
MRPDCQCDDLGAEAAGGGDILTLEDLRNYTGEVRELLTIDYNGCEITSCASLSGSQAALAALKIFGRRIGLMKVCDMRTG